MSRPKGRKNGERLITICAECKKSVETSNKNRKFCSRKCFEINERIEINGVCQFCNKHLKNIQPSGKKKRKKFCSLSCAAKARPRKRGYSLSEEHKRKISDAQKGSKSIHWRGGVTPWQKIARRTPEARTWRKAVFEKDNYTCQFCGVKGGTLNADHIKPWIKYPDLRTDISNGRTLCKPCHKTTPTYARNLKYQ